MTNPRYIKQEWEIFLRECGLEDAPVIQKAEMRQAFFAGALSYSTVMLRQLADTGNPNEVTPRDDQVMKWLMEELQEWGGRLIAECS